jgi:hypothetical protein
MHEVNVRLAHLRPVVREPVQLTLGRAPVELTGPVSQQVRKPFPVGALCPRRTGSRLWQPGLPDPAAQVIEHRLINGDRERLDLERCDSAGTHSTIFPAGAW